MKGIKNYLVRKLNKTSWTNGGESKIPASVPLSVFATTVHFERTVQTALQAATAVVSSHEWDDCGDKGNSVYSRGYPRPC